jgi:capsular exopolysaccharide synthesis family protein
MMMEQQGEAEGATPEAVFSLLEGVVHETEQPGLYLLTSGTLPPNPAELAASVKMGELLESLKAYFDVVLIDSPPELAATDAVVLSTRADGVLLVASYGRTRRGQLEQAAERLRDVRATVYGVIMNRLSGKADGYYSFFSYSDPLHQGGLDSVKGESNGRRGLFGRKGQAERPRLPNFTARTKP